jgi:hypothetical protein
MLPILSVKAIWTYLPGLNIARHPHPASLPHLTLTGFTFVVVREFILLTLSLNICFLCIILCFLCLFFVASMARHIYLRPGVGVGAFKTLHGASKNRGNRPSHHADSSGSIARKALQALEKLKLLQKDPKG